MGRLLTLALYSVLIVIVLILGVATASPSYSQATYSEGGGSPVPVDIVPAKVVQVVDTDKTYCHVDLTDLPNWQYSQCQSYFENLTWSTDSHQVSFYSWISLPPKNVAGNAFVAKYKFVRSDGSIAGYENRIASYFVRFKDGYECPPDNNPDYSLPTSNPNEQNSEGKYCKKPEENKCKQQTLNNPLDDDGLDLYYYRSSLSGCFDGCTMTFKSDPDAEATFNAGGSVLSALLARCSSVSFIRCTGPLMYYDGTQCAGSDIQTGAEPTTSGAEPTTSGAEPTTSGATGTDPNCYGTNQGDKCNGTSGATGTGGGSGSGSGAGSGSGSGAGTGTSGGSGTGSDSGTGDDFVEKASSYCKSNPDSVVCAKLGTADAEKVTDDIINVSVTPDAGWGPATAQCPAPVKIDLGFLNAGASIDYSYSNFCDFLSKLRMPLIGLAWLIAAFIMIGWRTGGDD